jgi:hypothetical protein
LQKLEAPAAPAAPDDTGADAGDEDGIDMAVAGLVAQRDPQATKDSEQFLGVCLNASVSSISEWSTPSIRALRRGEATLCSPPLRGPSPQSPDRPHALALVAT